jgi:hypothetical protein
MSARPIIRPIDSLPSQILLKLLILHHKLFQQPLKPSIKPAKFPNPLPRKIHISSQLLISPPNLTIALFQSADLLFMQVCLLVKLFEGVFEVGD